MHIYIYIEHIYIYTHVYIYMVSIYIFQEHTHILDIFGLWSPTITISYTFMCTYYITVKLIFCLSTFLILWWRCEGMPGGAPPQGTYPSGPGDLWRRRSRGEAGSREVQSPTLRLDPWSWWIGNRDINLGISLINGVITCYNYGFLGYG